MPLAAAPLAEREAVVAGGVPYPLRRLARSAAALYRQEEPAPAGAEGTGNGKAGSRSEGAEEVARGEVARGEVARGEVARGEVARGEVARGEVARGLAAALPHPGAQAPGREPRAVGLPPRLVVKVLGAVLASMALLALLGQGLGEFMGTSKPGPGEAPQQEISLGGMRPGEVIRIPWHGSRDQGIAEVLILRRTPEQIRWLRQQPAYAYPAAPLSPLMSARYRSYSPDYLVVAVRHRADMHNLQDIADERVTEAWCDDFRYTAEVIPVNRGPGDQHLPGGFYCGAMYGEMYNGPTLPYIYDPAGRPVLAGYAPLLIPPHYFRGDTLVLGYDP